VIKKYCKKTSELFALQLPVSSRQTRLYILGQSLVAFKIKMFFYILTTIFASVLAYYLYAKASHKHANLPPGKNNYNLHK
jgi:hypothetical protein